MGDQYREESIYFIIIFVIVIILLLLILLLLELSDVALLFFSSCTPLHQLFSNLFLFVQTLYSAISLIFNLQPSFVLKLNSCLGWTFHFDDLNIASLLMTS